MCRCSQGRRAPDEFLHWVVAMEAHFEENEVKKSQRVIVVEKSLARKLAKKWKVAW